MLRSLYAYKGTHARTLGFQMGEGFLEVGTSRDPNWLHVISERGSVGYVPKNYVASEEPEAVAMLEFIDGCLEATHLNASERGGNYSRGEQEALQRLVELRQKWHARCPPSSAPPGKRSAPPPPQRSASQLSADNVTSLGGSGSGGLPSPNPPSSPRLPPLPSSDSSASLASEDQQKQRQERQQQGSEGGGVETTTSFMARGDSLVREESSGSSEGHDSSIGYESEMRSDGESAGVHASVRSLVSQIPDGYLRMLVEEVRSTTSVSFTASHQVVEVVLKSLGRVLPPLHPLCSHILTSKNTGHRDVGDDFWQRSVDGSRLVGLLEELRACKDDEQQRSWALHEDEHTIAAHLTALLDLLNTGDLEVCRRVLALDDFRPLLTLVQYYQMDTRWPLRRILLKVFGTVCQMSAANISYLSASVFPVELAREMLENTCGEEQLRYISLVLGMVLCMGDTLPYPHFSVMNESFLELLLEGIERYNERPDTEQLAELYLTLVLAFNLQYSTPPATSLSGASSSSLPNSSTSLFNGVVGPGESKGGGGESAEGGGVARGRERTSSQGGDMENVLIRLLGHRKQTKHFTEKLLLLFNREEDPLAMFEHEPRPPHSVLKMMQDMYSTHATASIFYTNDERVVCDIIIRQLTDLPADDRRRNEYLRLLGGVVGSGGWQEHLHRCSEVTVCCSNILAEEEPAAVKDQDLVRKLFDAYPKFFGGNGN